MIVQEREQGPNDAGRARRLEWAQLLKRILAIDMLVRARCQGPMRLVSVINDEPTAVEILGRLGLPSRGPRRA